MLILEFEDQLLLSRGVSSCALIVPAHYGPNPIQHSSTNIAVPMGHRIHSIVGAVFCYGGCRVVSIFPAHPPPTLLHFLLYSSSGTH